MAAVVWAVASGDCACQYGTPKQKFASSYSLTGIGGSEDVASVDGSIGLWRRNSSSDDRGGAEGGESDGEDGLGQHFDGD